jgi:hypothetical protein
MKAAGLWRQSWLLLSALAGDASGWLQSYSELPQLDGPDQLPDYATRLGMRVNGRRRNHNRRLRKAD